MSISVVRKTNFDINVDLDDIYKWINTTFQNLEKRDRHFDLQMSKNWTIAQVKMLLPDCRNIGFFHLWFSTERKMIIIVCTIKDFISHMMMKLTLFRNTRWNCPYSYVGSQNKIHILNRKIRNLMISRSLLSESIHRLIKHYSILVIIQISQHFYLLEGEYRGLTDSHPPVSKNCDCFFFDKFFDRSE